MVCVDMSVLHPTEHREELIHLGIKEVDGDRDAESNTGKHNIVLIPDCVDRYGGNHRDSEVPERIVSIGNTSYQQYTYHSQWLAVDILDMATLSFVGATSVQ